MLKKTVLKGHLPRNVEGTGGKKGLILVVYILQKLNHVYFITLLSRKRIEGVFVY